MGFFARFAYDFGSSPNSLASWAHFYHSFDIEAVAGSRGVACQRLTSHFQDWVHFCWNSLSLEVRSALRSVE